ncbi:pilus assembly protein PilZ [Anaerobacillus alkaliphilus]|uniref:Pilus assembly protein PilZ n=1 Tax=Anaerobacillus alkaliphilus TaxID=1548597 RepID=A0A4Q0VWB4_9BACI|nr:flagellar brake domain-containing protein [Anaerobacillus alkaliphilus]RXJ03924.1 pilus assembly protein PilZ [Anaerobacillus alkaliphilus]
MLNIGDTIFLEIDDEKEEEKQRFKCRLVDRVREYLFIDYPINDRTKKVGFFHDGTQFGASFIGKDQAVYLFQTQLVGRKKARIPMLVLIDPGQDKYNRIQRRQHVRVDASIDVAVHSINKEFTPFVSVTADISGGGIALVLPKNHTFSGGEDIICWLSIHLQTGEIKYVKVECHVIRIISTKDSPREKASIQFSNINENDRQTIIRYVFERQLYLRKKGMTE